MIYTEKEAEEFLRKEDFNIVQGVFVSNVRDLKKICNKKNFPFVMKISGKEIVHKNKVKGVRKDVGNYAESLKIFRELRKIKGTEEILIQKQVEGEEFLLGIKKTPEFGHVIVFGAGGINTEKLKDTSFRVCSFGSSEAAKMIKEVRAAEGIEKESREKIIENILHLNELAEKYPDIKELDINPLIVSGKKAVVTDARIVWN